LSVVWKDVYQLFECKSTTCGNFGFSYWRKDNIHFLLDSDTMNRLVEHVEEGKKLDTHDDVPETLRELICTRKREEDERRARKRRASSRDVAPIIVHVCDRHHDNSIGDCTSGNGHLKQLKLPVPEDEAPIMYADWLSARVSNQRWRDAYRLAGNIIVEEGFTLSWLFAYQKDGMDMLMEKGVLRGVTAQFVSRILESVNDIETN
jgi:hypothetical protein